MTEPIIDRGPKDVWLVLSGSGLKLYAFLGAMRALVRVGYRFLGVRGTSGGAIVAAALGAHWDPRNPIDSIERMIQVATTFHVGDYLDPRWRLTRLVWPWGGPKGVYKGNALLKGLREHLPPTFERANLPVEVVTFQVNLEDPRTIIHTKGDLPLAVRASMSIPFLFDPVRIGDGLHVDGGWMANFSLPDVGEDVVGLYFGHHPSGGELQPVANNLQLAGKLVEGAMDENVRQSIVNAPMAEKIPLSTSLGALEFNASQTSIEKAVAEGEASAEKYLGRMP